MTTKTKKTTNSKLTVKIGSKFLKEKGEGEERTYNFVRNPAYASHFTTQKAARECLSRFLIHAAGSAEVGPLIKKKAA